MTDKPPQTPAHARVEAFLVAELPPGGTRLSGQLKAAAEASGVPWRSIQRHAKASGVVFESTATPSGRETLWTRPADPKPPAPEPTDRDGVPVRRGTLGRQAAALLGHYPRTNR